MVNKNKYINCREQMYVENNKYKSNGTMHFTIIPAVTCVTLIDILFFAVFNCLKTYIYFSVSKY